MKVRVAAVQMKITPWDLNKNYERIKHYFKIAHREKANFICFPEECWVGLDYEEKVTNEVSDFVKDKCSTLSKNYGIYCIAGTVNEKHLKGTPHIHNFSYLFGNDGKIIGRYAKRHLVPHTEGLFRTKGSKHRVFDTEFGKIGIQICRDILYPEVTQVHANMGAKIIFSPAFWSKFSTAYKSSINTLHANDEVRAIRYLVPARAIENEVFFVFTNAAGKYNSPTRKDILLGYTQICEPSVGPIKRFKNNKEGVLIRTIDTDIVDQTREGWRIRHN